MEERVGYEEIRGRRESRRRRVGQAEGAAGDGVDPRCGQEGGALDVASSHEQRERRGGDGSLAEPEAGRGNDTLRCAS
eukprot:768532-Hanusia_phi.AAC.3